MCDVEMTFPSHNASFPFATITHPQAMEPTLSRPNLNWSTAFQRYLYQVNNGSGSNTPPISAPPSPPHLGNISSLISTSSTATSTTNNTNVINNAMNPLLSITTLTNLCDAELSKYNQKINELPTSPISVATTTTTTSNQFERKPSPIPLSHSICANLTDISPDKQIALLLKQEQLLQQQILLQQQQIQQQQLQQQLLQQQQINKGRRSPVSEGSSINNSQDNIEGKNTFSCCWDQCNEMFSTRTGLATHCSSHLARYIPSPPSPNSNSSSPYPANSKKIKTTMHCKWNECKEIFYSLKDLAKHLSEESHVGQTPFLAKEHEEECTEKNKKKKRYACSFVTCGRLFADSSNRKKHERTHDLNRERFYCTEKGCTKSYSTKTDLNIHMKAHKGEFPHKCTYPNCNKVFVRLSELYAHERSHDNILPHLCTVCGKRFREKARLKTHEEGHNIASVDSN